MWGLLRWGFDCGQPPATLDRARFQRQGGSHTASMKARCESRGACRKLETAWIIPFVDASAPRGDKVGIFERGADGPIYDRAVIPTAW